MHWRVYVYMCVCLYECMYVCQYVSMCVAMVEQNCIYLYLCIFIFLCVYVYKCLYVYMCVWECIQCVSYIYYCVVGVYHVM